MEIKLNITVSLEIINSREVLMLIKMMFWQLLPYIIFQHNICKYDKPYILTPHIII